MSAERDDQERWRRAADAIREGLPAPPEDLGDRVLAAVRAEHDAGAAEPAGRAAGPRRRLRRLLTPPRLAVVGASVLAIGVWGPNLGPLRAPSEASAVPVAPLPTDCDAADRDRLEVAGVWAGAEADGFARVLQRFERQTGVEVVYHYETRDIAAKLDERLARGCPPDVALLPQPGLMRDLAARGAIRPLSPAAKRLSRAGYGPTWRRMARVGGELHGIWFKASDKSTLWFRPAALRAAGIDAPPRTWHELREAAAALREAGMEPLAVAGDDGWTLTDWFENVLLREAGTRTYDALARGDLPWTDARVRAALRRVARLVSDEEVAGGARVVLGTDFEDSVRRALGPGATAALVYEGDFVANFLDRGAGAPRVAFADFPAIGRRAARGSVVGGDLAVRFTPTEGARRLMRFLATPQAAEAWAARGGFVSPNRLVRPDVYPDPLTRAAALRLSHATVVRFDLSDLQPPGFGSTAGQGMWELFRQLPRGPQVVDRLAARLQREAVAARGSARR